MLKQTVLGWLVGGDEERAILLHNYLAALHYEVYVLLGMAVPEGETAFLSEQNQPDDASHQSFNRNHKKRHRSNWRHATSLGFIQPKRRNYLLNSN
jgi:hypothetical protein